MPAALTSCDADVWGAALYAQELLCNRNDTYGKKRSKINPKTCSVKHTSDDNCWNSLDRCWATTFYICWLVLLVLLVHFLWRFLTKSKAVKSEPALTAVSRKESIATQVTDINDIISTTNH